MKSLFLALTIVLFICLSMVSLTSSFPIFSKLAKLLFPSRTKPKENPKVTLTVEIPESFVHYSKPLNVRSGGRFYLETPTEQYVYISSGRSKLKRVNTAYLMQSMYNPNLMCFYLHFWSKKDSAATWNTPLLKPPWLRNGRPA